MARPSGYRPNGDGRRDAGRISGVAFYQRLQSAGLGEARSGGAGEKRVREMIEFKMDLSLACALIGFTVSCFALAWAIQSVAPIVVYCAMIALAGYVLHGEDGDDKPKQ
jgi:hypothetical protein